MKRIWVALIVAGAAIAGIVFFIWALNIQIQPIQIIIVALVALAIAASYLFFKFNKTATERIQPTQKIVEEIFNDWRKQYDEELAYEGHSIKVKFYPEVNKHFLGGIFNRQNSPIPVHIIWCIEDRRIWVSNDDPTNPSVLSDPLCNFMPTPQLPVKVTKTGKAVLPIELKAKEEEEEEVKK